MLGKVQVWKPGLLSWVDVDNLSPSHLVFCWGLVWFWSRIMWGLQHRGCVGGQSCYVDVLLA